jgi:hypothetical protein
MRRQEQELKRRDLMLGFGAMALPASARAGMDDAAVDTSRLIAIAKKHLSKHAGAVQHVDRLAIADFSTFSAKLRITFWTWKQGGPRRYSWRMARGQTLRIPVGCEAFRMSKAPKPLHKVHISLARPIQDSMACRAV